MNAIHFFDWGLKRKPKLDLWNLFLVLSDAFHSNKLSAIADLKIAMDNTSRVNLTYLSLQTQQPPETSFIEINFTVPEDIDENYLLSYSFKNIPYFYEVCKYTIWFFDGADVGRYDMINTEEYPFTVGTTISLNKKYKKNSYLTLIIKER
jgi:hypothetical protein